MEYQRSSSGVSVEYQRSSVGVSLEYVEYVEYLAYLEYFWSIFGVFWSRSIAFSPLNYSLLEKEVVLIVFDRVILTMMESKMWL